MISFSVKINMADTELYENFIEPRKNNGELPNLVVRLLTAYATDANISYQIDQFLDKDEAPDMCDARDAIFKALERFNELDSSIAQGMEALNDISGTAEVQSDDDEYDIVTGDSTENTGMDAENVDVVTVNKPMLTAEMPSAGAERRVEVPKQDTVAEAVAKPVSNMGNTAAVNNQTPAAFTPNNANDSTVLTALSALTTQMSQLTTSVSSMVSMWQTMPMQMMPPMGYGMMPGMQMANPYGQAQGMPNMQGVQGVQGQMPVQGMPTQGQMPMPNAPTGTPNMQNMPMQGQMANSYIQSAVLQEQADMAQAQNGMTQAQNSMVQPQMNTPQVQTPVSPVENIAQPETQGTVTEAPTAGIVLAKPDKPEVAVKAPIQLSKPTESAPENSIVANENVGEIAEQAATEDEASDDSALDFLSNFESSLLGT